MRGESVYKLAFNATLEILAAEKIAAPLPTETALAQRLTASRTTVRKVIAELRERKLVKNVEGTWRVARRPKKPDYFPAAETVATYARVEKKFMEWMLRADRQPGDVVNGLELARQFKVSTGVIREYLSRFSRFGLIERRPNSSWIISRLTEADKCRLSRFFRSRRAVPSPSQRRLAKSLHRRFLQHHIAYFPLSLSVEQGRRTRAQSRRDS
jgi:DNA-binding GntR family transcriptional regulator